MTRNTRQSQTGVDAHHCRRIGVADSACFHPNSHLTRAGLSDRPFHHSELAGLIDFHCSVSAFHLRVSLLYIPMDPTSSSLPVEEFGHVTGERASVLKQRPVTRVRVDDELCIG